jgi:hypothetical protein
MEGLQWEWSWRGNPEETKGALMEIARSMASDTVLMPATLFYLFILPLSRSYFDNGEHYEKNKAMWKKIMAGYNWCLCLFSLGCFISSASVLYRTTLYTEDCLLLDSQPVYAFTRKIFYYSKFVEYADTLFLYVMNRPISYLQWVHHIGAAWLMFCAGHFRAEPSWIFVHFNSFIHTFMYLYYALSLAPKKWKGLDFFKPIVTSAQIVQFLTGFAFLYGYRNVKCFRNDGTRMFGVYYHTWAYVGVVLLLFINFYIRNYCMKSKKPRQPKGDAAVEVNGNKHANGVTNGQEANAKPKKPKKED